MTAEKFKQIKSELEQEYRSVAGFTLLFDHEGYLWEPKDWNEKVAVALARECGIADLSENHWKVVNFMREYYFTYGRAPLNSQLKKGTGLSIAEINALFPGGIKKDGRRIAGLPNPRACL
ncbi:MAG: TusE/DsrC/DsvC family sulfur relay protein [Firmicutes bacterium]|nr:TusE/DsrC/DsvC family sulfur relay protein [Bacillota bacterium]